MLHVHAQFDSITPLHETKTFWVQIWLFRPLYFPSSVSLGPPALKYKYARWSTVAFFKYDKPKNYLLLVYIKGESIRQSRAGPTLPLNKLCNFSAIHTYTIWIMSGSSNLGFAIALSKNQVDNGQDLVDSLGHNSQERTDMKKYLNLNTKLTRRWKYKSRLSIFQLLMRCWFPGLRIGFKPFLP